MIFILFLLIALAVLLLPIQGAAAVALMPLGLAVLGMALVWLVVVTIYPIFILRALQRAERTTPYAMSLAARCNSLHWAFAAARAAAILALAAAVDWLWMGVFSPNVLLALSIAAQGVVCSALWWHYKVIWQYTDPFMALALLEEEAKKNSKDLPERAQEFCDWIGTLCEISTRAISKSKPALATSALHHLVSGAAAFFPRTPVIHDSQRYVLFFLLGRLDYAHTVAVREQCEALATEVTTSAGKIALTLGKNCPALAAIPIQSIGRWTVRGQRAALHDVGVKGSCLLVELAKGLLAGECLDNEALQETLIAIAAQLAEIARTTFRLDKSVNVLIITQPLHDLQHLVEAVRRTDLSRVSIAIKGFLEEFSALQDILRTIPPLPKAPAEPKQ